MPDEPMTLSDLPWAGDVAAELLNWLRELNIKIHPWRRAFHAKVVDLVEARDAFQSARIAALTEALARTQIGVNHIATYRTAAWPDVGTAHEIALERLGAGREYDMWCCWNAAMQALAALDNATPESEGKG